MTPSIDAAGPKASNPPMADVQPLPAVPQELETLADRIGAIIEYWGFKRIHGRVWCHLYLAGGPVDAGWLVHRLGVSKALVSTTLKDLRHYDVIAESGVSPQGTQLFHANPAIVSVILKVLKTREERLISAAQAAAQELGRLSPAEMRSAWVDPQRARQLVALTDSAAQLLRQVTALGVLDLTVLEAFQSDWPVDPEGQPR